MAAFGSAADVAFLGDSDEIADLMTSP